MDPAERRLVLGTAGHIDHGKTALVRALTGVDTDRLPEEKERGITIDLGFAALDLPDGTRLGVVDVPGHEGLVRTMVAGATGIDLLLLVVAADEGVMPQTREHLAICELLGITRAVVALSKIDAAEPDVADLAAEEVAELLAPSALAGAPIVRVSAATGEGLDALREALAARAADTPARTPRSGPPRLPIDRCFEVRGFGSVVTGTLIGGELCVGDVVDLYPDGRRARIRGIQLHGEPVERASPGARCAVNLQGVSRAELARGMVVSGPDALVSTHCLDVQIHWLREAPAIEAPSSVSLLTGTAERRARVAPIGRAALCPGERGFARLHVDGDPLPALPGDRFVLRGFARMALGATVGGGLILDVLPPRRRRSDPLLHRDLEELAMREPARDVAVRARRAGLAGASTEALRRETGLAGVQLRSALDAARATGQVETTGLRVIHGEALSHLERRLAEAVDAYHAAEPLQPGMPSGTLRGALPDNVPSSVADLALAALVAKRGYVVEQDRVRRADHRPTLDPASRELCDAILAVLGEAGLETPSLRDLGSRLSESEDRLRDLLAHLEREGRVVRAPGNLWFEAGAVEALRGRVRAHFVGSTELDTPAFKALIGTTRRTSVPLMELLDQERLTVRRGDVRRLRSPPKTQSRQE